MSGSLIIRHVDEVQPKVDIVHDLLAHPKQSISVERGTCRVVHPILRDCMQDADIA